jgi:hypothetical protein
MAANLPKDQFELARQRAAQRASQQASEAKGALQRRFAQLGTLQGGERLKLEQQAEEQSNQLRQEAEESIQAAEVAEAQRKQEITEGREFAKSERIGAQDWQSQMQKSSFDFSRGEREASQLYGTTEREAAQKYGTTEREAAQKYGTTEREASQKYATEERIGSQSFAHNEAALQRGWQAEERISSQNFAGAQAKLDRLFQAGETEKARKLQTQLFYDQLGFEAQKLDVEKQQFLKTLEEEIRVANFNMEQANKPEGRSFMEKLLDPTDSFGRQSKLLKKWKIAK